MKTLILIRGLPGSGKSTLARAMREACAATAHWEADMYFTDNGKYTFDPAKLEQRTGGAKTLSVSALEATRLTP